MTSAQHGQRRLPDADLLSRQEISRVLGVSTRTLYEMVARGAFPPPLALTGKTQRWPRAVVLRALGLAEEGGGAEGGAR